MKSWVRGESDSTSLAILPADLCPPVFHHTFTMKKRPRAKEPERHTMELARLMITRELTESQIDLISIFARRASCKRHDPRQT